MDKFTLHIIENYEDGGEREYQFQTPYDVDDMLGIIKTYMGYSDNASSFVFTVAKEPVPEHKVEGTQANFDRYIAGDR